MSAEQESGNERRGFAFYLGYYAAKFVYRANELGGRACQAIARGSSEPVNDGFCPNVAPLRLTSRDRAHLQLLYTHIETPAELNAVILDVQRGPEQP